MQNERRNLTQQQTSPTPGCMKNHLERTAAEIDRLAVVTQAPVPTVRNLRLRNIFLKCWTFVGGGSASSRGRGKGQSRRCCWRTQFVDLMFVFFGFFWSEHGEIIGSARSCPKVR
ncbi:Hypothetical protein, putative [Bodo saltans]|uniref:Uncharacterized protein n=1 Tax=Bodo saltans TaxID=75058 RepID=A0A0S4KG06_BODSA|nr:Hypothetical protein, putative [Bodo saltans]|eukprot:CUI14530.1 Hypothetical protein, putative [Bodo saltans]